jgi:hypothetical protein
MICAPRDQLASRFPHGWAGLCWLPVLMPMADDAMQSAELAYLRGTAGLERTNDLPDSAS